MNKEIKPAYANFEQAKWLKEKGFTEICICHAVYDNGVLKSSIQVFNRDNFELAPEQHQVVEWLRVNHGIWVEVCHKLITEQFFFEIVMNEGETHHNNEKLLFDTPQKAYSAAFDYIRLNNLI